MNQEPLLHRFSTEAFFYVAIWTIVLLVPVSHEAYDYLTGFSDQFEWRELGRDYLHYVPFLVIFLIGKLALEPRLFFKGRQSAFYAASFLTAFVVILAAGYVLPARKPRVRSKWATELRARYEEAVRTYTQSASPADSLRFVEVVTPPSRHPYDGHHRLLHYVRGPFFPKLLMALLMLGSSLAIAVIFRTRRDRLLYEEQLSARLQSELDYLKYQINPHFFMNTLNNIHALVDIDGELAKQAIIELSRLMRYLLYETNQPTIPLRKEITIIRHYLELMKIRLDDSVTLTMREPDTGSKGLDVGIPPMLLISFIENAFKHGISHKEPSYIDIAICYEPEQDGRLHFHVANSNFSQVSMQAQQGGVGLDNVRKRLDLIYRDRYKLHIVPTDKEFTVDLWLPASIPS